MKTMSLDTEVPSPPEAELGLALQVRVMAQAVINLAQQLEEAGRPSPRMLERLVTMAADITTDATKVLRVADQFSLLDDQDSDESHSAREMVRTVTAMNRKVQRLSESP